MGVIANVSGAVLVVALLLPWWGTPPVFLDPPAGAPAEITFLADSLGDTFTEITGDAYAFFELKDLVWLLTGVVGFGFGLALTAGRSWSALNRAIDETYLLTAALIAIALVNPPDYFAIGLDESGPGQPDVDVEAPFGRKIGGFVALAASICLIATSALTIRVRK